MSWADRLDRVWRATINSAAGHALFLFCIGGIFFSLVMAALAVTVLPWAIGFLWLAGLLG